MVDISNKKRLMKPVIFDKTSNEVKLFEYACAIENFSDWVKAKLTDELFTKAESSAYAEIKQEAPIKVKVNSKNEKVVWKGFPS